MLNVLIGVKEIVEGRENSLPLLVSVRRSRGTSQQTAKAEEYFWQ